MENVFIVMGIVMIINGAVMYAKSKLNESMKEEKAEKARASKPQYKLATTLPDAPPSRKQVESDDPFDMFSSDSEPVKEPAIAVVAPSRAATAVDLQVPAYLRKGVKLSF